MDLTSWVTAFVCAYLLGSIPFGLIIARTKGVDIRQHGSGNIGATNVGRVLGKRYGYVCFVLDFLKGALPTAAVGAWAGYFHTANQTLAPLDQATWLSIAAAAMLGHIFSPWVKFKGGKGVATAFGALMAMWPAMTIPALVAFAIWAAVVRVSRFVSLGSVTAAALLPVFAATWASLGGSRDDAIAARLGAAWPNITVTFLLGAVVVIKHRANIARLLAGSEERIAP